MENGLTHQIRTATRNSFPAGLIATMTLSGLSGEGPCLEQQVAAIAAAPPTVCTIFSVAPLSRGATSALESLKAYSTSLREEALLRDIAAYTTLEDGWDGYDGRAPDSNVLFDLKSFVEGLPPGLAIPTVTLSSSGLPSLYWDDRDYYADLEFQGGGVSTFFATSKVSAQEKRTFSEFASIEEAADSVLSLLDALAS